MKLKLLSALVVTCFLWISHVSLAQDNRPNLIFLIADDISWNDFGCYGNPVVRTPHIDQLAQEGIMFTNVYLTASSCSPSRTSMISGRYPHNTGSAELHTALPEEIIPFPLLLKQAGYYTVQAGKSHFGQPALRAFDKAYENQGGGSSGSERWVQCLQERPMDQPIFAWFAAFDAHRDWQADDFGQPHDPEEVIVPPYLVDNKATRQDLASYYNEVSRFDYYVGQVVEELKRQEVFENTLIMVLADNGRPFPRCKTRVYDSGMKTPFVVHWGSGIEQPGAVSNSLISVIDIAPTLVELGGTEPIDGFQGKSFLPVLKDPSQEFRRYVFAEHNWHDYEAHERMVRTKNFLYVLNSRPSLAQQGPADSNRSPSFRSLQQVRDQGHLNQAQADVFMKPRPAEELFDCIQDPMQISNIASLPQYKEVLIDMRNVMIQWRKVTKDDTPENLTGDWFDRETGEGLSQEQRVRGTMPGAESGAVQVQKEDLTIF